MRRITLFIVSTIASLVLLFGYHTSRGGSAPAAATVGAGPVGIVSGDTASGDTASGGAASGGAASGGTASGGNASGTGPTPTAAGSAPPPSTANLIVNGTVAQTRWGPMQVQVIIKAGKITDVKALQYPDGNNRDQEINSYALPALHDQVIAAQSANIDGISGATVTSDGYQRSLQAALDTAHFK